MQSVGTRRNEKMAQIELKLDANSFFGGGESVIGYH